MLDTRLKKLRAIECVRVGIRLQTEFAAGGPEAARKHLGIRSAAGLTTSEPRVIRTPPAGLLYPAQDAILTVGEVRAEPLGKYVEQFMWQAQENIACLVGAGTCNRRKYRLDF